MEVLTHAGGSVSTSRRVISWKPRRIAIGVSEPTLNGSAPAARARMGNASTTKQEEKATALSARCLQRCAQVMLLLSHLFTAGRWIQRRRRCAPCALHLGRLGRHKAAKGGMRRRY